MKLWSWQESALSFLQERKAVILCAETVKDSWERQIMGLATPPPKPITVGVPSAAAAPRKTLHHLDPGTLFRDRDSLWRVCEPDEDAERNGNISATRIASWNVNRTGEMMFYDQTVESLSRGTYENYNAYNEVILVAGIYEVIGNCMRSPLMEE